MHSYVRMPAQGRLEVDLDIDRALDELRRAFPRVCIWYGEFSGSLWALLPDRLVEAKTAADLARQLYAVFGRPRPQVMRRPVPSSRRPDGTWRAPVRREVVARHPRRVFGRLLVSVLRLAKTSALPATPAW